MPFRSPPFTYTCDATLHTNRSPTPWCCHYSCCLGAQQRESISWRKTWNHTACSGQSKCRGNIFTPPLLPLPMMHGQAASGRVRGKRHGECVRSKVYAKEIYICTAHGVITNDAPGPNTRQVDVQGKRHGIIQHARVKVNAFQRELMRPPGRLACAQCEYSVILDECSG